MKLQQGGIAATLAAIALLCGPLAAAQIGIVSVTGGRMEGVTADGVTSFKGIPFAAPPVGALRWRPPQAVGSWSGVKKADHFAPGCMQPSEAVVLLGEPPTMSEDCLYLNGAAPRFTFPPNTPHGSPHGAEIGYVFDNLGTLVQTAANAPALAAMIGSYWVNFARTGNPNGPGLPHWPAFDDRSQRVMVFDAHPSARALPNRRQLEALDRYFTWTRQQERSPAQTRH